MPVSLALAGVVALAGCGTTAPVAPSADATSTGATPTSRESTALPTSTIPTAPPSTRIPPTTLTGTVDSAAVEGSCLMLETAGRAYLLVGAVTGLTAGQRAIVTGHVDTAVVTTCQTGTPFVVERVDWTGPPTG